MKRWRGLFICLLMGEGFGRGNDIYGIGDVYFDVNLHFRSYLGIQVFLSYTIGGLSELFLYIFIEPTSERAYRFLGGRTDG